jgi:TolB protein
MKSLFLALLPLAFVVFGCSTPESEETAAHHHGEAGITHGEAAHPHGEADITHGAASHPHGAAADVPVAAGEPALADLLSEEKTHLANLRRITTGGADAEAYFSPDGKSLVLQATRGDHAHDQIYTVGVDGSNLRRISPGPGKTTCSFHFPGGERIVYATTHFEPDAAMIETDRRKGERWAFEPSFDVVSCRVDGSDVRRITTDPGYDAECAVSRTTGQIVFCSLRTGDPEIFTMDADGTNVTQLTSGKGYDGGPFFSVDGKKIIWRIYSPVTEAQEAQYDAFVARKVVGSWPFDIWIMNVDGTEKQRVTTRGEKEGLTCWAPYLHPDNKTIVFVSQSSPPGGRGMPNFDLFTVDVDGRNLERITFAPGFEGFPMFSDDGKTIAFVSSRGSVKRGEISIYLADWVP